MDDQDRENVITVELAFQRELACRKKVAMFELHQYDDELLPLPVEFLSPCLSSSSTQISGSGSGSGSGSTGVNQLVVHNKNGVVQQLQLIDGTQTLNGVKKVKLASQDPFSNLNASPSCSLSGMKQAACPNNLEPIPSLPIGDEKTANSSNRHIVCKICQICCSGPQQYEQHIGGKKHQVKAQEAARRKVLEQREWCGLCKIWCMKSSLQQHIEGQRHRKKL